MMASNPHSFYPYLSTWHNSAFPTPAPASTSPLSATTNSQLTPSMFQPALTPTSGSSSPPASRNYEEPSNTVGVATNGSVSPDHHAHYGYPPTPPKDIKAEENYYSTSGLSGSMSITENYLTAGHTIKRPEQGSDTYSLPSPSSTATPTATPTSSASYEMTPFSGAFSNFSGIKKSASKSKNSNAATGMFYFRFYFV